MKKPEGQPKFNFDKEPESEPISFSEQQKKSRERIEAGMAVDRSYEETRKKVYSLLSREEQKELDSLSTFSEKRAYVVRKYSKLFGSID